MYKEIGAFDAKARLSELLREVREGHRYTITVRGEPVAELVPVGSGAGGSCRKSVALPASNCATG